MRRPGRTPGLRRWKYPSSGDDFSGLGYNHAYGCRIALVVGEPVQVAVRSGPHNHRIMTSTFTLSALMLTGLLGTTPAPLASAPYTPPTNDAVVLTGWVHVEDLSFDNTRVKLEVNGEEHIVPLSPLGRFDINLPVGTEAVLRFEHPGHLPKEVVVDTHDARAGEFKDETRHVKMAVILELERLMAGMTYAGPVGNIAFDKEGGCVAVDRTRKMIVGRKNEPMVF